MDAKPVLVVLAVAAAYVLFLARYVNACAGGADSSGYLSFGRLLCEGRTLAAMREVPGLGSSRGSIYVFCPLGFTPAREAGRLAPAYPPGLPILLAVGSRLVGPERAGDWLMLSHAAGALVMMFALCRLLGVSRAVSLACALILGLSPLVLMYSVQMMSDVPAMTWTLAYVVLTIASLRRPWAGILAGAALGVAFLVRPTCALAGPVLCLYVWFGVRGAENGPGAREGDGIRPGAGGGRTAMTWLIRAVPFAIGCAPLLALHFVLAKRLYGSALSTGYGDVGHLFSWTHVGSSLAGYVTDLPGLLSPLVLLWPLCALAPAVPRATRILVIGVPAAFMALYSAYFGTSLSWWQLRFVLPAAPLLIAGGALAAECLWKPLRRALARAQPWMAARLGQRALAWAVAAILVAFAWHSWRVDRSVHFMNSGRSDARYRAAIGRLAAVAPPGAVCACMQTSGAIFYYSDLAIVRADQLDAAFSREFYEWASSSKVSVYAALFDWEEKWIVSAPSPGHWSLVEKDDPILLWKWVP